MAITFGRGQILPSLKVEIAFESDPYAATPVWTDVTVYVRGEVSIKRGRNVELGSNEAGTAAFVLENLDGRFDPLNTVSPYAPYVLPYRQVRITGSDGTTVYPIFRGFVERFPQTWAQGGNYGTVNVTAVDGFKTALAFTYGPRYADLVTAFSPAIIAHFDEASVSEPNTGFAGGTIGIAAGTTGTSPTFQQAPLVKSGTSSYSALLAPGNGGFGFTATAATGAFAGTVGNFCGWCKPRADRTDSYISPLVSSYDSTNNVYINRVAIEYGTTAGSQRFVARLQNGNFGNYTVLTSTTAPVASKTYFVAVTYQQASSGGSATLYVNGVAEASVSSLLAPSLGVNNNTFIGLSVLPTPITFDGYLDEFVIGEGAGANFNVGTNPTAGDYLKKYAAGTQTREYPQQDSGARVTAILDTVMWPTARRVVDTGSSSVQATGSLAGNTALTTMRTAADAELGNVFIDGQGRVVFRNRVARNSRTTVLTFGEGSGETAYLEGLTVDFDDTQVQNDVQVAQAGTTFLAESLDYPSQGTYGLRVLSRTVPLANTADVTGQAATLLARYKQPVARLSSLPIELKSYPAAIPSVLVREIGDLVTVKRRPLGAAVITLQAFVDGIEDRISASTWTRTFLLTPKFADSTY